MLNFFEYAGKRSNNFGLYISGGGTYGAPQRDIETVSIPGRNGDLIIDNGRFNNITVTYSAYIRRDFRKLADAARAWLLSQAGYARLEDTYNPGYYRLGIFTGPLDFATRFLNLGGECDLSFNCKPQRFLKSGEAAIEATGPLQLHNPTLYPALPLIRVYGASGTLTVGNDIMQISEIDEYIDIDSDTQNAYKGVTNCNPDISGAFGTLPAGQTGISFSGDITKIEIKPRWWTL